MAAVAASCGDSRLGIPEVEAFEHGLGFIPNMDSGQVKLSLEPLSLFIH